MPVYEYRCRSCQKLSSHFFRSFSAVTEVDCPQCGAKDLERVISRVAIVKGEASRLSNLDTRDYVGKLYGDGLDKRELTSWARRMSKELGGEMGAHFHESAEKIEAGEMVHGLYDPEHALRYAADTQRQRLGEGKKEDEPKSDEPMTIADLHP